MNKKDFLEQTLELENTCIDIAETLWNHPEVSGEEIFAQTYLSDVLSREGFRIVSAHQDIKAFTAEYGEGKPVIAILAEYDALPGLSQACKAVKSPLSEGAPGHGCGHNLLGSAGVTAAIALKRLLERNPGMGTVRLYGCPREELLDGKVIMLRDGMFDGCDFVLAWHPMDAFAVYDKAYLANIPVHFNFCGKTSHAGVAPELGRSALDAVELLSVGANYLREHVVDQTRIHYSTSGSSYPPNIVPDKASAWYFIRSPRMSDVRDILRRLVLVARGAAMMTETELDVRVDTGCYDMVSETSFADLLYQNMLEIPLPIYTEEEMAFARDLQQAVSETALRQKKNDLALSENESGPLMQQCSSRDRYLTAKINASSDLGDVSYVLPLGSFTAACWPIGIAPHTWPATASAGNSIGRKGAFYAARVFAATGYDLFTDPGVRRRIQEEFAAKKLKYAAVLPEDQHYPVQE